MDGRKHLSFRPGSHAGIRTRRAVSLFTADAAILEAREIRKDVPCTVAPIKPALGFDLKFHAGYDVSVPLKELAGSDNLLTMVFRVAPDQKPTMRSTSRSAGMCP